MIKRLIPVLAAVIVHFTLCVALVSGQQEIQISQNSDLESELSVAINPNDPNELVVASMRSGAPIQVFHSDDGGQSWDQSSFSSGLADPVVTYGDNGTAYLVLLDFDSTLKLNYATSTDNGNNWNENVLTLDGKAVDRPWIRRDNFSTSPFYGNTYVGYFHPESGADIHVVKIAGNGAVGANHSIQSNNYSYVQNPALDVTKNGELVICFLTQHSDDSFNIMSVASTDGSDTFSPEVLVSPVHMYDANGTPVRNVVGFAPGASSRLQNSLQMAIDKSNGPFAGRVYLTWTDFEDLNPDEGMDVYLSYSDDLGANWSSPTIVNDDNVASSHQYFSAISVNPNGVLALSWYDRRSDPSNDAQTDFYLSYSTDGGTTFAQSTRLNTVTSDHTAVTMGLTTFGVGEYTSLATSDDHAFAIWADGRGNDGDMNVYLSKVDLQTEVTVNPGGVKVINGSYVAGGIAELTTSDNSDYSARRNNQDIQTRVTIAVDGTSPTPNPSSLSFTLESSVFARSDVNQIVELFDFDSSAWAAVDTRLASRFNDATVVATPTGDLSRFVEPGTMALKSRVRYVSPVGRLLFSANIDLMVWEIGQ